MLTESLVPRHVRILLVGEPGVGKTSLILSLVSEEFTEYAPPKAEEITIPADVTPEQVPTNIVDFSAAEQSTDTLIEEIHKAHVVCVIYAVDQQDTIDKVRSHWLPLIRECADGNQRKPVVLVGNKTDLIESSTMEYAVEIADEFPEVDRCIECSARTITNVSEMFYNAQKAVLHPLGPIFCVDTQELTDKCKKALTRIFKLCDIDGDRLLNDCELNHFQQICFDAPLQLQVLDEVKSVLAKNIAGGIDNDCVTLRGFLFLHNLFIQRGRNETTWTVLRKFGYDETLSMSHNYLYPSLKVPTGCTTELSYRGQQFLTLLFERHDRDKDGALSSSELRSAFSCCPKIPWHNVRETVPTNEKGHVTLQGWMCRWTLMALTDLQNALAYLAYLGYNIYENDSQKTAIQVTREKKIDLAKKQSSRNVYQCHIIGPRSCGKSTLCRNFLGISHKKPRTPLERGGGGGELETEMQSCINTVQVYGQEKYLVLREIPISRVSDPLQPSEVNCDVACLVYDATLSRSFEYIARIYIKYFADSKIPVLMVGTRRDAGAVRQDYLLQPDVFCRKYQVLPPQYVCLREVGRDLFVKLATMAAFPPLRRMVHLLYLRPQPTEWFSSCCRHLKQFAKLPGEQAGWWKAGLGVAAATFVGLVLMRALTHHHKG